MNAERADPPPAQQPVPVSVSLPVPERVRRQYPPPTHLDPQITQITQMSTHPSTTTRCHPERGPEGADEGSGQSRGSPDSEWTELCSQLFSAGLTLRTASQPLTQIPRRRPLGASLGMTLCGCAGVGGGGQCSSVFFCVQFSLGREAGFSIFDFQFLIQTSRAPTFERISSNRSSNLD